MQHCHGDSGYSHLQKRELSKDTVHLQALLFYSESNLRCSAT